MQKEASAGAERWKGPEDVEIVTFSAADNGAPVLLGGNDYGRIYAGRMRFRDGSVSRVAIKRFNNPIGDDEAGKYAQTIEELKTAGVRIPKMGMVKLRVGTTVGAEALPQDEWVQVSQMFGSVGKGSKVAGKSQGLIGTPEGRLEAVKELTKIANAGHYPTLDVFEPFKNASKGVIPLDIDKLIELKRVFGQPTPQSRADYLMHAIEEITFSLDAQDPERRQLQTEALKGANPQIMAALKKITPD